MILTPSVSATPSLRGLQRLTPNQRTQFLATLTTEEALSVNYAWRDLWGRECTMRPDGFYDGQIAPPGAWNIWMLCAGRGYGKTRAGAEWVQEQVEKHGKRRGVIVAATAADLRDTIVEGESGILNIAPPWFRPQYLPSKSRLVWPNGAVCLLRSAEKPDRMRGPQYDFAWGDELAAWRYVDAFDQLMFGLRLGKHPQAIFTTTPRPTPVIMSLFDRYAAHDNVVITKGDTFANKANLAASFLREIQAKYGGTRLGRQEMYAELLTDTPGALWNRDLIEALRVTSHPALKRVVIGIDPSVTANANSAETGIIVAGLGVDNHAYIIDDRSLKGTPLEWALAACDAMDEYGADVMVAEVNNGGDLVEMNIRGASDRYINVHKVRATRGKYLRAEPVAALYEQRRVHHVGYFGPLEDQQTTWTQGEKSPDRLDALVWTLWELMDVAGDTPEPRAWSVDTEPVAAASARRMIELTPARQTAYYEDEWID